MDTYQGQPDISFVRTSLTEEASYALGPDPQYDQLVHDLREAGFPLLPNKVYAVYYRGNAQAALGLATAEEKMGFVFQRGPAATTRTVTCCVNRMSYIETTILHETLHTLDFVAPCAPHIDASGAHVSDYVYDIMSPRAFTQSDQAVLDYHHDDYFMHNIPGCPDFALSPYLVK